MSDHHELLRNLEDFLVKAMAEIGNCKSSADIENLRVRFLGKKGVLTSEFLKKLGGLDSEIRPVIGSKTNEVKDKIQEAFSQKLLSMKGEEDRLFEESLWVDITIPGSRREIGFEHLVKKTQKEMEDLFISMGYEVKHGPEIEDVFYAFEALNTPEWHPARDSQDSFYIESGKILLRPHTSPVQIRTMESIKPPLAIVSPGKVYRSDYDATHLPMFHQFEGLLVDRDINVSHLKGTLEYFVSSIFKKEMTIRLRPSFFPFTEPSFEVDLMWEDKYGGYKWLEVLGAGLVDPNVFKAVGYDPEIWSGFAFGVGIERITMLKYGLTDIRDLIRGDLRFIRQ